MINRENWEDTKEFTAYLARIGREETTVLKVRGCLRYLLEWAGAVPFPKARSIDPSLQTYLITARLAGGRPGNMSAGTMKQVCNYARLFFTWVRSEHLLRYKTITASWIATIQPGTAKNMHSEFREHQFWELEQVRAIAALDPANLTEERDRAAVCFMYLSAMRAQAFVSLPVEAVDLVRFRVSQFPELGVHTKNSKAAQTALLRVPDLLEVVQAWDRKIRAAGCLLWFPRIDRWHRFLGKERALNWKSRSSLLGDGIRHLCERAGIPYLSSHKLRHGHTVYAMRRIKDMKQLKALSQNLMHSSVAITDGIYGRLVSDDIADVYDGLGE